MTGETMFPPRAPFFFAVHGLRESLASRPAEPASGREGQAHRRAPKGRLIGWPSLHRATYGVSPASFSAQSGV
jgi:hypothetical protein